MQEKRPTQPVCGATRNQDLLVVSLTLLVCNRAGSLASRLAGCLAVAATALCSALLQISLVDRHNVLHMYLPPILLQSITLYFIIAYYLRKCKRFCKFFQEKSELVFTRDFEPISGQLCAVSKDEIRRNTWSFQGFQTKIRCKDAEKLPWHLVKTGFQFFPGQNAAMGHSAHFGFRAEQISRPNSTTR